MHARPAHAHDGRVRGKPRHTGPDEDRPDRVGHSPAVRRGPTFSVADLGCGTGYYAESLVERVPVARLLAADRSPDAVRATLRALTDRVPTTGIVLDLWRPLPLRDASADVLLDVFAPRNPREYARVLRPGGALIVVVPTAAHLLGLRESAGMLDIPGGKDVLVTEQFAAVGLQVASAARVEYVIESDASTRTLIAGMGPAAHHHQPDGEGSPAARAGTEASVTGTRADSTPVTVSVDVLTFQKP
ncbi:class I SAM-dependent methyltransferase [Agromyces aerolatus]|uniref:class I SAM-dependent methyltransferase n=1 Tax=Agromyces sp. LY-1074 TaxID=3074080 RepID=UPI00285D51BC|nr:MULTISPECIES: class I SAM-dependent methyltransferase [unclassified Agromyces]MDR5700125.1 class I SAM-dependent methyltransferase [Agromyces sp. LY-1074]MDR5706507.1 class I SAM-dependent methyltransferase [Agromyces sp. LY-1358]